MDESTRRHLSCDFAEHVLPLVMKKFQRDCEAALMLARLRAVGATVYREDLDEAVDVLAKVETEQARSRGVSAVEAIWVALMSGSLCSGAFAFDAVAEYHGWQSRELADEIEWQDQRRKFYGVTT